MGKVYKSFKNMEIWQNASDMAVRIFEITKDLPRNEDYGLTSQIRRSALSISANIAEAFGRYHAAEKINFYHFSRGSLFETQSHLAYGIKVGYFDKATTEKIDKELTRLHADINKVTFTLKLLKG